MNESGRLDLQTFDQGSWPAVTGPDDLPAAGAFLTDPDDVLADPTMTGAEKRMVLASWVSDARAVTDAPALRQLGNGAVVRVDDVLRALKVLDGSVAVPAPRPPATFPRRRKMASVLSGRAVRRRRPDDDDPPPRPANAAFPVSYLSDTALAA